MQKYPNDVIVIADDDVVYPADWLERLVSAYQNNPEYINALRVHKVAKYRNNIQNYLLWDSCDEDTQEPSYNNFATGVGGVIYKREHFYKDVCNESIFLRLCPTSDDIWFWTMAVLQGTKTRLITPSFSDVGCIDGTQEQALWKINNDKGGNDLAIKNILMFYPELNDKIANNKDTAWYIQKHIDFYMRPLRHRLKLVAKNILYKSESGKRLYDSLKHIKNKLKGKN